MLRNIVLEVIQKKEHIVRKGNLVGKYEIMKSYFLYNLVWSPFFQDYNPWQDFYVCRASAVTLVSPELEKIWRKKYFGAGFVGNVFYYLPPCEVVQCVVCVGFTSVISSRDHPPPKKKQYIFPIIFADNMTWYFSLILFSLHFKILKWIFQKSTEFPSPTLVFL